MKALSLTPPWSEMILHHGKRIENREAWSDCRYRGPILLHASKGIGTRAAFDSTCEQILNVLPQQGERTHRLLPFAQLVPVKRFSDLLWRPTDKMLRGGIVGRARVVDVIRMGPSDPFEHWVTKGAGSATLVARRDQRRWWFGGFALVLDDVEPLPFVPWKGALGLFEVPDDYAARAEVLQQIEAPT